MKAKASQASRYPLLSTALRQMAAPFGKFCSVSFPVEAEAQMESEEQLCWATGLKEFASVKFVLDCFVEMLAGVCVSKSLCMRVWYECVCVSVCVCVCV